MEEVKREVMAFNRSNLHAESVRSLMTTVRLCVRQGMTFAECQEVVAEMANTPAPAHRWAPEGFVMLAKPQLRNKGVNDMRDRG